ncbi:MAG: hypothetical protein IPO92_18650 [Saprospiraceae bacterium]|nr:hypothetical protein [Saprospiraceae bacterium]
MISVYKRFGSDPKNVVKEVAIPMNQNIKKAAPILPESGLQLTTFTPYRYHKLYQSFSFYSYREYFYRRYLGKKNNISLSSFSGQSTSFSAYQKVSPTFLICQKLNPTPGTV